MHQVYLGNGASSAKEWREREGGIAAATAASNLSLTEWGASGNGRGRAGICDMGDEMWMGSVRPYQAKAKLGAARPATEKANMWQRQNRGNGSLAQDE